MTCDWDLPIPAREGLRHAYQHWTALAADRRWADQPSAREAFQAAGRALLEAMDGLVEPKSGIARSHGRLMYAGLALQRVAAAPELSATLFEICETLLAAERAAASTTPEPIEAPLDLTTYPLDRCAALTASIDLSPGNRVDLLKRAELDEATWQRLTLHWEQAIFEELRGGGRALLELYDRAYVDHLEKERGEISVDDYARLKVALSRGTQGAALAALGLPSAAMVRIERVWLSKIVSDASLRNRARRAIQAHRQPRGTP